MKIAFVCPHFYPHIGGVETVVLQLASNLAAGGDEVTILTQTKDATLARREKFHNFTIHRFHEFGVGELKISLGLFRYLQKNSGKYDVIHAHNYHSFPALCAALTKKIPLIFSPHYHGTGHTVLTHLIHYPYRYIGKFIFSQSDVILCDSDAEKILINKHFTPNRELILIPLGIDVQRIRQAKKIANMSDYVISIGRLENYKNVELLINSLAFINPDVNLKIVGDGPKEKELRDLVEERNLSSRISFLKNISNEDLYRLLKTAKAYITMSSMEAYGLSLLEAAAAQIGIVASDIPAHQELVKRYKIINVTLLHLNSSPEDLAHSITEAIAKHSQMNERLPSWEFVTKETSQIYKTLV